MSFKPNRYVLYEPGSVLHNAYVAYWSVWANTLFKTLYIYNCV
jgi:hypothetical protein